MKLLEDKLIKLFSIRILNGYDNYTSIKQVCIYKIDEIFKNPYYKDFKNYDILQYELLQLNNLIIHNDYEIANFKKYIDISRTKINSDSNINKETKELLINIFSYIRNNYNNYFIFNKRKFIFPNEKRVKLIKKILAKAENKGIIKGITTLFKRKKQGGSKIPNPISIEKVFKLFYNFIGNEKTDDVNSVYKLYFLLNIYGIYSTNKELLLKLIEIIDSDKYTEEIFKIIENLLDEILIITKEIFKDYIKVFNETDKIIKNYYLNHEQLIKYLHINILYDIYKNLEEIDINLNFVINNISLNINKTNKEIKDEILEMFNKNDFIFSNYEIIIKNQSINSDITYLMEVIYDMTNNSDVTIDNMNDLNVFLIMELLSNEGTIELIINNKTYKIPNINHKPYKFVEFKPIINLNKNQLELYEYLLNPLNYSKLFAILKKNFYFIDFDIDKHYNYKFNINNEILNLINVNKIEKKPIINYSNSITSIDIKMVPILQIKANTYLSLVNYGLYLTAGIFMKSSNYNFMSLLYTYLILKNSSFNFTNDYSYVINFFERVLFTMRKFLVIKYDIDNFIKIIINFKNTNTYLKEFIETIKIDTNFLKTLYRFNGDSKIDDIVDDYIKSLQTSFIYLIDNCNNYKELDLLIQTYFIPIITGLKQSKRDIEELEKMVIDLNAKSLKIKLIPESLIKGGAIDMIPINITNQSKTQPEITEQEKDELNNKLGYISRFIKDYKDFNSINTLNINKGFIKQFKDFIDNNEAMTENLNAVDPTSESTFNTKITPIKLETNQKLAKVKKERELYGKNTSNDDKGEYDRKISDFETRLKTIKDTYIPFLQKYKTINNQDIKNILGIILKKDEDDTDNLFDNIDKQIRIYRKVIDKYKKELEFTETGLLEMIKTIKDLESKYDVLVNARAKETKEERDARRKKEEAKEEERRKKEEEEAKKLVGGSKFLDDFKTDLDNIAKLNVTDKITKLEGNIKKIKKDSKIEIDESTAIKNKINDNPLNIFERIMNKYEEDSKASIPEIAKAKLYERVVENNLDPAIELEITFMDKIIFIVTIIIIRTIALFITNYFIDNGTIIVIQQAIKYYTINYLIVFLILFLIINIDIFRLRIIFNYMNMHCNSTGILVHLLIKIITGYIVYLLIVNIDNSSKPTKLSKHQKIKLKNKLDILTIAILVFLIVFILVI